MNLHSDKYLGISQNNVGKFLFLLGVSMLLLGLMFLSSISSLYEYSWVSSIGLFLGVIFIGIGMSILLDSYSVTGFLGRITSILSSISFGFFGGFLVAISYVRVVRYYTIPSISHGIRSERLVPLLDYPYSWLVFPFLVCGLSLLGISIIARIVRGAF